MDLNKERVYDSRSREYLQEVIACYDIGSYRSAIVLLNSVCLCDIFYKLQELRDDIKKLKQACEKDDER